MVSMMMEEEDVYFYIGQKKFLTSRIGYSVSKRTSSSNNNLYSNEEWHHETAEFKVGYRGGHRVICSFVSIVCTYVSNKPR